jgi:alcohol dehydrogenase class IV
VRALLGWLAERTGQPTTLSECGVTEDQLPAIAKLAVDDGSIGMNPKDASTGEILAILQAAL